MKFIALLPLCALAAAISGCQLTSTSGSNATVCYTLPAVTSAASIDGQTIDLQGQSPDAITSRLNRANPRDLILIDSETKNNAKSMDRIAASKVHFCMVAEKSQEEAAGMLLAAPLGTPQILAVLPEGSGINKGINTAASRRIAHYIERSRDQYKYVRDASVLSGERTEAFHETVMKEIRARKAGDPFIIVGHNGGGYLEGPNGEDSVTFADINDACHQASRLAVILSCSTIKDIDQFHHGFVTPRDLEIDEVAIALQKTQTDLAGRQNLTVKDLMASLSMALDVPRRQKRRKVIAVVTVVGSLVLLITVYEVNCEDANRPCSK